MSKLVVPSFHQGCILTGAPIGAWKCNFPRLSDRRKNRKKRVRERERERETERENENENENEGKREERYNWQKRGYM